MQINYSLVTEFPGQKVSIEELKMIHCRYHTAAEFVSGEKVLEVGCGPGLGLGYLLEKGAKMIVGGDYTEQNIKHAGKTYEDNSDIEILLLDAQKLPFKSDSFDVVLLFEVLFYLNQPEEFFEECVRVLNKNGVLILCLPNKLTPSFRPSPFSTIYFNSGQLLSLLKKYFNKVMIYGAFPIKGSIFILRFISLIRFITALILDLSGPGKKLKELLKKPVFNRNITLKNITEENMCCEESLTPINSESPDIRHRILYAVADSK